MGGGGPITRGGFARALLERLDYPTSKHNFHALVSWMVAEGGPSLDGSYDPEQARFNPLNTTRATDDVGRQLPGISTFNSAGVRNYASFEQGVAATAWTLLEHGHGYGPIRRHLKRNEFAGQTIRAVEASDWGTSGLAGRVLPGVQMHYDQYADKPIGQ